MTRMRQKPVFTEIDMREKSSAASRRRFIASAGALCAGTVAQSSTTTAIAASVAGMPGDRSFPFSASRFRDCVGSLFQVQALGRDVPPASLILTKVVPSPFRTAGTRSATLSERAFSIDLVGVKESLAQDTYVVSHPDLGEFVALLVPSADGRTLTAVFHTFG